MEKYIPCKWEAKVGVAILIPDKLDLKIKITRDKEEHYIMIKGSVQEKDITIVNIYAPNRGAPQCCDARYQLQEKNCKKHKHMEIKQHVSK